MQNTKIVWVLLDSATGHMNQVLGIAEALGLHYEAKSINYNKLAKIPNLFLYSSIAGLTPQVAAQIKAPWPDVVISAGRKTLPVARYIKKRSHGLAKLVHIMDPGFPRWGVDLLVIPEHDRVKADKRTIVTLGAPNRVQPDFLAHQAAIWEKTLEAYPRPRIAVMLGGNTDEIAFTALDGQKLAQGLDGLLQGKGSLLITSSRRTPKSFTDMFRYALKSPHYFHDPNSPSRTNPYYAFLALSDLLVVTADSVSMLSEACTTGLPVMVFVPEHFASSKHQKLANKLVEQGYAGWLGDPIPQKGNFPRLAASWEVANIIRERFL